MSDNQPDTPRAPLKSLTDATEAVAGVASAADGLVVVVTNGMRRAILLIVACGVLLAASTVGIFWMVAKVRSQTEALDVLITRVTQLSEKQAETKKTAEETAAKVDDAKAALDEKPTVELVTTPKTPSKPAGVAVRIQPAAKNPGKAPPAPAIEIPVRLPDAKVQQPADAGTENQ